MELTHEEINYLQKLIYNDMLIQNYRVRTEQIEEIPNVIYDILEKLEKSQEVIQNEN